MICSSISSIHLNNLNAFSMRYHHSTNLDFHFTSFTWRKSCFKDHANKKTNHQNIGTLKQSNLCIEIFEYVDKLTTAICTLASTVLKNYVNNKKFDFNLLHKNVKKTVKALNKVIDINHYSTEKGKKGGLEQRAIAIGVQGFADTIYLMDLVFNEEEGRALNKMIAETIYHAAVEASCELVKEKEVISNLATIGIYYWSKGNDYVKYAEQMISKDIRYGQSFNGSGEFYVAPVYNESILDGKIIKPYSVEKMYGLGTPEDLETFVRTYESK